jgi:hypothetical protein
VQIAVNIDGFRARVVMDCFYENTFNRQLEGTFKLRLPHEASPYYFAFGETVLLDKDRERIPFENYKNKSISLTPEDIKYRRQTSWNNVKEARIVPREKAAYAYTETTHRRVDPAIMEWAGADIFNCRVFPLQPNKLHRVVIGYDLDLQNVGDDKVLTIAVPSAQGPVCIDIDMAKLDDCTPVLSPSKELFNYDGRQSCHFENPKVNEISIRYPHPGATVISGTTDDNRNYWAASVKIDLPQSNNNEIEENAIFLVDASLSSNPENFNIWLSMMNAILKNNEDIIKQFGVLFFNVESYCWKEQAIENTDANRDDLMRFANNRVLEGATDIGQALAAVKTISFSEASEHRTIFLLSDGAITWGEQEPGIVIQMLNRNDRVYGYVTGSAGTDTRLLEYLTRNSGGSLFTVSGEDQILEASRAFRTQTWKIDQAMVGDCQDILIKGRPGHVYNGQYLTITGRGNLPENAQISLSLSHLNEKKTVAIPFVDKINSKLAVRAYGQIATAQLEESGPSIEKYATSYALHFTIPGQTCALLMLESEQDYHRYAIKSENDALTVVAFTVASLLENSSEKENRSSMDQKSAFVTWLHKLEQLPDIGFKIGLPLELVVRAIPEASFSISPPVLSCTIHSKDQVPEPYKTQIRKTEPGYASVTSETERRRKFVSVHDALKALSSLVECNPGNSEIMRDVGYTVMELGLDGHAYHLFYQVAKNRPFEPQTYCALGLVLTNMNNADLAVVFYEVALAGHWNPRYGDFRKIAILDYLHLLRSIEKKKYQVHFKEFAAERARSLALEVSEKNADLMVAITWNTDNTDIDLHINEPSGEECYYSNKMTRIGGAMSQDVTTGYGPEMYVLQKAPSGKYRISVHNYSDNNNRTGVRTTIYTTIYRNWGKAGEKLTRKKVVLQKVKELDQLLEITI